MVTIPRTVRPACNVIVDDDVPLGLVTIPRTVRPACNSKGFDYVWNCLQVTIPRTVRPACN